jgi:D-3-phosphoglycerate dehydrogenase
LPVVESRGIPRKNIFANSFLLDDEGFIVGFDSRNPLIHSVLAEGLGPDVNYYDIVENIPLGNATKCDSLRELLKRVDIVNVHVDNNPHNNNFLSDREFRLMKEGALFLNLSRGFVVDETALARAVESGKVGGAAVDVSREDPSSKGAAFETPLWGLENVILTPHLGGSTREAQQNIADYVAGALISFINTGNSFRSVNFPDVRLPDLRRAHQFIHLHRNEPGVLAAINLVMAEHKINILGQYLKTNERVGYVITDVSKKYQSAVIEELRHVPRTIRFRVLY